MRRILICFTAFLWAALAGVPARADIVVATYFDSSVLRYTDKGAPLGAIVPPGGMSGVLAPGGITLGPDGLLYVSNQASVFVPGFPDSIVTVNPADGTVTPFVILPADAYHPGAFVPASLRFGPDGYLYVSHNGGFTAADGSGSVDRFDASGNFVDSPVTNLSQPTGLLFDANGNLYVSNFSSGSITKFHPRTGQASTLIAPASSPLAAPAGLQIGADGRLYVVDLLLGAVRTYDPHSGAYRGDYVPDGGVLSNQFPSDLLFIKRDKLLVADLGDSQTEAHGTIKLFNARRVYRGNFASNLSGASQLVYLPGQ
jgi:DNA-binding beta-propeller fold protein YncE